jgi:uncharacterized damage-inducible protein DinB
MVWIGPYGRGRTTSVSAAWAASSSTTSELPSAGASGFETQGTDEGPEPELEPLPTIDELRERWQAEWAAVDAWLPTLTDGFVQYGARRGVPVWRMLVHVVNHGTQHRAEAAALLTAEGRSPGELDLINYAEEQAGVGSTEA